MRTEDQWERGGLDWPLMRENITREDLDAVIAYLQQEEPILTQSANVRGGMVGLGRCPAQRPGQLGFLGESGNAGGTEGPVRGR
jgi:hypothetical protein